jgi:hypothetical protein
MSSIVIKGDTSGQIEIAAPAVAGSNTLTLPATTGTIGIYANPQITIYTSGSGTYTTPTNAKYLVVEVIGGGGGGGGGGYSTDHGAGGAGGNTTFGTSLLTAEGAPSSKTSSVAGDATIGAGATGLAQRGNTGGGFFAYSDGNFGTGGIGGAGVYGGCGYGRANNVGTDAQDNSGAGGGGGGAGTAGVLKYTGAGGGAGGYIKAWITSPSASYAYAVGAGGTGGAAGTNGFVGGAGGSGLIIVTAYFG